MGGYPHIGDRNIGERNNLKSWKLKTLWVNKRKALWNRIEQAKEKIRYLILKTRWLN